MTQNEYSWKSDLEIRMETSRDEIVGHGFLALLLYLGFVMFLIFILKIGAIYRGLS